MLCPALVRAARFLLSPDTRHRGGRLADEPIDGLIEQLGLIDEREMFGSRKYYQLRSCNGGVNLPQNPHRQRVILSGNYQRRNLESLELIRELD